VSWVLVAILADQTSPLSCTNAVEPLSPQVRSEFFHKLWSRIKAADWKD